MKRPAFKLDTGGCTCASCKETNGYAAKGFAAWPRGNPAGRKSAAAYAGHVAYGARVSDRLIPPDLLRIRPEPIFSTVGLFMPVAQNAAAVRWNAAQKSQGPDLPAPARPAPACKAGAALPGRRQGRAGIC